MRKTILLQFKHDVGIPKPRRFKIVYESATSIHVSSITKGKTGIGSVPYYMTLTKLEDGTLRNENRVDFIVVKADRRPKPFAVKFFSPMEGNSRKVTKFATLAEAAQYVFDRWQGVDYMDSGTAFHTDYAVFETVGFTLADIFTFETSNGFTESMRKVF